MAVVAHDNKGALSSLSIEEESGFNFRQPVRTESEMLFRSAYVRRKLFRSFFLLFIIAIILLILVFDRHDDNKNFFFEDKLINFEGFDNQTGVDHFIVPNIIHLIRMNQTEFTFTDWLCLQAAYRNHRPDYFYIHTDSPDGKFTGKYWHFIEKDLELRSRIIILPIEAPWEIFGQKLSPKWR